MFNKKLHKVFALLLTLAPAMALGIISGFLFGEPKLPNKLKKQ